jgi:replicative DNA helicase
LSRNINILEKGISSGVPSGLKLLDNVTNGWQPSDLIILAGRPGSGKTASAVSMIMKPCIDDNIPVALFSLEMSNAQIGSRIQSYISGVNVSKIVKGQLNMDEIRAITNDGVVLHNAPLYIDDTPNISLIELKSKARKLVKDKGVRLIVIDYLQLMRSGMDVQNREQEIAEISKGLKNLAKELNIPVIALSQLSRAVEQTADKKPSLSHLRECLSVETSLIYEENNVQYNTNSPKKILSLNKKSIKSMDSINIPKIENDVYRVKTKTGRFIDATENHPVLTSEGYKKVKDLKADDSLALAKNWVNESGKYIKHSKYIGWMIGNGCMYGYNVPSFITNDEDVSDSFCEQVRNLFNVEPKNHKHHKSKVFQWDLTKSSVRTAEGNPITNWHKENDLWGKKSYNKVIPEWWMKAADETSVCELLSGLWETDGSIYLIKDKAVFSYSTTSILLANQILYLLARLGIISYLDNGYLSEKATTPIFKITIGDSFYQKIFRNKIKLLGLKGKKIESYNLDKRVSYVSNRVSRDTTVKIASMIKKGRIQIHGNRRATQETLKKMLLKNNLPEYNWLISDNIHWDDIESIEYVGVRQVFDRSVPKTNNFVVNGIIVHNSGTLEQDADMVIFCFRPEYYNIDTYEIGNQVFQSHGLMMLIIGKHRNGEIGEIPVKFIHQQAKIDNMYIAGLSNANDNNSTNNFDNSNNSNTFVPTSSGAKLLDNNDFLNQSKDETVF